MERERERAGVTWGLGNKRQDNDIDPAVLTLGLKFADWLIVGGNARTSHLLEALCQVIMDHEAPDMHTSADLSRLLDARLKPLISYIVACRPLSIGMGNAIRSASPVSPSARVTRCRLVSHVAALCHTLPPCGTRCRPTCLLAAHIAAACVPVSGPVTPRCGTSRTCPRLRVAYGPCTAAPSLSERARERRGQREREREGDRDRQTKERIPTQGAQAPDELLRSPRHPRPRRVLSWRRAWRALDSGAHKGARAHEARRGQA